ILRSIFPVLGSRGLRRLYQDFFWQYLLPVPHYPEEKNHDDDQQCLASDTFLLRLALIFHSRNLSLRESSRKIPLLPQFPKGLPLNQNLESARQSCLSQFSKP